MAPGTKNAGEIWTRLFNHRPFIQGEVTFFLREFQDKSDNKEVLQLSKILEYIIELEHDHLNCVEQLGDCHLPSLKVNVDIALNMCDCVLQRENKSKIVLLFNRKLEENRKIRKNEREKFENDINKKWAKVNEELQNKKKKLKTFYTDLQKKLHILS